MSFHPHSLMLWLPTCCLTQLFCYPVVLYLSWIYWVFSKNSTTLRRQPLVAFRGNASLSPQWRQVAVAAAITNWCPPQLVGVTQMLLPEEKGFQFSSLHWPVCISLLASAGSSSLILLGFGPYRLIPVVFLWEILTCTCECGINMYTPTAPSTRASAPSRRAEADCTTAAAAALSLVSLHNTDYNPEI